MPDRQRLEDKDVVLKGRPAVSVFWFDNYAFYYCAYVTTALLRRWNLKSRWLLGIRYGTRELCLSSSLPMPRRRSRFFGRSLRFVYKRAELCTYLYGKSNRCLDYFIRVCLPKCDCLHSGVFLVVSFICMSPLNTNWVVLIVLLYHLRSLPCENAYNWLVSSLVNQLLLINNL